MRLDRFQKLAIATTAATYVLLAVGGLVRAAGAGLGCPDWPKCFGLWIPPTHPSELPAAFDPASFNAAHTWIEYVNRLVSVVVGFLILGTAVVALRRHRKSPRVLLPTLGAFFLVLLVAWLGKEVVQSRLDPIVLTAHLVLALLVASLLLFATFAAFFPGGRPPSLSPERRLVGRAALAVILLALFQVGLGTVIRGEIQELGRGPLPREAWLAAVGLTDVLHRNVAVLSSASVVALWWLVRKRAAGDARLDAWSRASVALVVAQVLAGLGLAYLGFPRTLQVAHLWLACLLLAALTMVALLAYRLDPRLNDAH